MNHYPHDKLTLLVHVIKEARSYNNKDHFRAIAFWWECKKTTSHDVVTRWQYEIENESPGNLFAWYDTFPKPPEKPGVYLYRGTIGGGGIDCCGETEDFWYDGEWKEITWAKAAMIAMGRSV